ncbi:hypothetical protein [Haladaptatus sp. NG-SE-30]
MIDSTTTAIHSGLIDGYMFVDQPLPIEETVHAQRVSIYLTVLSNVDDMCPSIKRRRLVEAGLTTFLAMSAGCSNQDNKVDSYLLIIESRFENKYDLEIEVKDENGEVIFEETFPLSKGESSLGTFKEKPYETTVTISETSDSTKYKWNHKSCTESSKLTQIISPGPGEKSSARYHCGKGQP